MSVYTSVSTDELKTFLTQFDAGTLVDFQGISAGIENTNYFVDTSAGRFVLTIFESLSMQELPYFLNLMAFLAEHDIPSAHPVASDDNKYLLELQGKPAALVKRLRGHEVTSPEPVHARQLGAELARLHKAGTGFSEHRANGRGPHWWRETTTKLESKVQTDDYAILSDEINFQMRYSRAELPRGVTHADLFRDNVLWEGTKITGLIDFYYACDDVLLYDVAVTVNAWFSLADGGLDTALARNFLRAYNEYRPLTETEREDWPVMLRAAALRFWLSRLNDMHFPKEGEMTHIKNPDEYRRILLHRRDHHQDLFDTWV